MGSIKHVAIIMDGNGRWAKERRRPRIWGHVRGSNKVSEVVTEASRLNLSSLTLYTFSTENWSRPTDEVTGLFKLLKKYLLREKKTLIKNNIKFDVVGNYRVLDSSIVAIIDEIKFATIDNTGLNLCLAINYGGRAEIVDAVNRVIQQKKTMEVSEEEISDNLYSSVPDIDLMIRTAGDKRISNFLLWQMSYAEMFFSETKWPDFSATEFKQIIESVSDRERRFGGIEKNSNLKLNQKKSSKNLKILS